MYEDGATNIKMYRSSYNFTEWSHKLLALFVRCQRFVRCYRISRINLLMLLEIVHFHVRVRAVPVSRKSASFRYVDGSVPVNGRCKDLRHLLVLAELLKFRTSLMGGKRFQAESKMASL